MPDISFDSLDAVPEGLKEVAKDNGSGKFVVNVVPASKLDEFRNNNIAVSKERDTLKAFKDQWAPILGEDQDAFKADIERLRTVDQEVKDGKLKGSKDIEAEVTRRVEAMKTGYETRLQEAERLRVAAEATASAADQKFKRSIVDRAITDAVLHEKSGAEPRALPDIIERASKVFVVGDDGKLTPKEGEAIIYGADGATPMTPAEWLGKLKEAAPYFFKASGGGNAGGGEKTKLPGNMSQKDFDALPPNKKLELARQAGR